MVKHMLSRANRNNEMKQLYLWLLHFLCVPTEADNALV